MVESNQSGRLWPQLYEPFRSFGSKLSEWLSPASEASSDEDSYRISIELPGVSEADVQLSATKDSLTVSGEKSESREDKGETWELRAELPEDMAAVINFLRGLS